MFRPLYMIETLFLPRGEGLAAVPRATLIGGAGDVCDRAALLDLGELHVYTAHEVCGWAKTSHIEEREDPHGHPEPPSDNLLCDFFTAVHPHFHHH